MTTKIQLRREVEEGLMENVNPMTSDECVILEDDRTLKQALDEMIYIELGDPTQGDGLITTEKRFNSHKRWSIIQPFRSNWFDNYFRIRREIGCYGQ